MTKSSPLADDLASNLATSDTWPFVKASRHAQSSAMAGGDIAWLEGGEARVMQIQARDGEGFESVLKRFTRGVQASGILREFRISQRFRSKADRIREKRRRAARNRKKRA